METTAGKGSLRRRFGAAGLLGAGIVAGGILAGSRIAGAATNASTSTASPSTGGAVTTAAANPGTTTHGPGEALLTDGAAAKVTAAAKAAVPGATVVRVETDSRGAAYEAHVRKANGNYVTVKLDSNFRVTAVQSGFGACPRGGASSGSGT